MNKSVRDSFLDLLKRLAKHRQKQVPQSKLSASQDFVAQQLSFNNWSMLSKSVAEMAPSAFYKLKLKAEAHPLLALALEQEHDPESAAEEMREWVNATFEPLVNFAPLDSESENGYAFHSVDIREQLAENFSDQYPDELIEKVADELEEEGPWGDEKAYFGDEGS